MKHILLLFTALLSVISFAQTKEEHAAAELLKRIAPSFSNNIDFKQSESPNDFYQLTTNNGKLVIIANNANSMAVGLNDFLKNDCNVSVSWYLNDRIVLPKQFPTIRTTEKIHARVKNRFFLNYCTFGYTMTWWKWDDWERFIDWMALNGVNLPLAITGQEKVWLNVWKKFGLSDEVIRSYFTGPAYLPWHRMANIDHWEGALPMSWIDSQAELQKQIVERERELNMKPVLPAFAGHVPFAIKEKYPNAHITSLGEWGDFSEQYQSFFLDSFDPLFKQIQTEFLKEQTRLFGTDHIYGTDPFNEVTPPSWEPQYLADVSKNIFESMKEVDSEAQWLQMTWIFFYEQNHWTNERIKAFLRAVPQDKMILLDYFCENTEIWKRTESYFGQPYIWCYLGNFGGNTMLDGNFKDIDAKIENVLKNGGQNLWGLGATLEGFGNNRALFEFVLEKAWRNIPYNDFVKTYASASGGKDNTKLTQAWNLLANKIYNNFSDTGHGDLTNSKPVFEGNYTWTVRQDVKYNNKDLLKVWELMLQSKTNTDVFYNDLTAVSKQVLGNYFQILRDAFTKAYRTRNVIEMEKAGNKMMALISDLDELLASNPNSLLGEWIMDARNIGIDGNEKRYYETDARRIVTVWGEKGHDLNDYANRSIAGLMKDYYGQRWKIFIDDVIQAVKDGKQPDEKAMMQKVNEFGWDWTAQNNDYSPTPIGNTLKISKKLYKKYQKEIFATH